MPKKKAEEPKKKAEPKKHFGNVYGTARGNRPAYFDRKREEESKNIKSKKEIEAGQKAEKEKIEKARQDAVDQVENQKIMEPKPLEACFSLIKNPKTMKYEMVADLNQCYHQDLGWMPFLPQDDPYAPAAQRALNDSEHERLKYWKLLGKQLTSLLEMKYNIFWSTISYDNAFPRFFDLFLRYCPRYYDARVLQAKEKAVMETPFDRFVFVFLARAVKTAVVQFFLVVLRLSRTSEQSYEFIGAEKHAIILRDKKLFTLPQVLDILSLYGHSNSDLVQRMASELFKGALHEQLQLESQFGMSVVDLLEGLTASANGIKTTSKSLGGDNTTSEEDDVGAFALDSCVVMAMIFDFLPRSCKEPLGRYKFAGKALGGWMRVCYGPALLHGDVSRAEQRLDELHKWIAMLAKEKEAWSGLRPYACFGLEALLSDWLASTFTNENRLKSVAKEAGITWVPVIVDGVLGAAGDVVSGGMSTQIASVREILGAKGEELDDGFLQEVLKSFHGNLQEAIVALMHPEGEGLPEHLKFLYTAKGEIKLHDKDKSLREFWEDPQERGHEHARDKARILERAQEQQEAEATLAAQQAAIDAMYDDEYDDTFDGLPAVSAGQVVGDQTGSDEDEDDDRWAHATHRGKGGKPKGGKGKGKGRGGGKNNGEIKGQSREANKKEKNKARVANHNRRAAHSKKMGKGMT